MATYYNEIDGFAAAWLRELIKAGLIADGEVDERSIEEVKAADLKGYVQCHFFAGIGVWSYALRRAGWRDDEPVWTGSCPCQPFSVIARGRRGNADARHLWPAWRELISRCAPAVVFGEQVSSTDGRYWLAGVRTEMEALGYAFGGADLCAAGLSAPHIRQRFYFVAERVEYAERERLERHGGNGDGSEKSRWDETQEDRPVTTTGGSNYWDKFGLAWDADGNKRRIQPGLEPLATGIAGRVGRLRGYGNALCAPVAEGFIKAYREIRLFP